jgi:hypothetical protein
MLSINRPAVIASGAVSNLRAFVTAVERFGSPYNPGDTPVLRFHDAATLAGANDANAIATIPVAALTPGVSIPLGVTSNGLVVSSVPSGVGLWIV